MSEPFCQVRVHRHPEERAFARVSKDEATELENALAICPLPCKALHLSGAARIQVQDVPGRLVIVRISKRRGVGCAVR